jgi:predicted dithiol-disulfide oxidoreductase (DUF899 family)
VHHTYSAYRRGLGDLNLSFPYSDLTPAGRQLGNDFGGPDFDLPCSYS